MRKLPIWLCGAVALLAACRETKPQAQATEPPTIVFQMRTFEKTRPGCGDHGNHAQACVSFRVAWPEMTGGAGEAAAKMNGAVLAALGFPEGPATMDPFGEEFISRWHVEHKGVIYADSTWFERRMVQVLARRPGVWSFQVDRIGQAGKALPFNERTYLNLNPVNGLPVTLNALLEKDAEAGLEVAAQRQVRARQAQPDGASAPPEEQPFVLPEQFALTPAGLVLAWDGETPGYTPGNTPGDRRASHIEITVPWSEARPLVRKDAVRPPSPDAEQGF